MTYTARLEFQGNLIMERHGDTPEEAEDALGFDGGPGYAIETIETEESE